ncbi:methylamine dehydrogenase (amicyanin) light chain [Pseudomonas sp. GD03858]|uniref:methylamine dehydrogenase light chain n=1 Tax=unclassified Pseudomonas TaxID=196821 RepID=UPI002447E416|nr:MULTISPECIES: methylamine dehydrogenase light chain [unclassified Pseudomonas]MDH0646961.1 methylamine dehydrogenase (amicyanin) light chain [Pseudomonas sp. GD03867]MDH0662696.1 methylamine dehydrogenase (amicyanin) light chain [Pseudomonas sp. GD03858]
MTIKWFDEATQLLTRRVARGTSRRSLLAGLGVLLVGSAATPLLPVFRGGAFAQSSAGLQESGDPNSCEYWRHCAIDGFLCGCCGGTASSCPPGTVRSDITWIGTCRNPTDGKDYVISYNDCCGKSNCGRCVCQRDQGDTPLYRPQSSNDLNWCSGSQADMPYHCSLSVVIGVKE